MSLKEDLMQQLGLSDADFERIKAEELDKLVNPVFDYSNLTTLEEVQALKHAEMRFQYKKAIEGDVVSSLIGDDGQNIVFGYAFKPDQLNYTKRATTFSLDPTLASCVLGTNSHGVVTLTKDEFLQLTQDFDNHEMGLYVKFDNLRTQIYNPVNTDEELAIEEVKSITW